MWSQQPGWVLALSERLSSEITQQQHAATAMSHGVTVQGLACCALPCGVFFNAGKSSFKINTNALIINTSSWSRPDRFDIIWQRYSHQIRPFVCFLNIYMLQRGVFIQGSLPAILSTFKSFLFSELQTCPRQGGRQRAHVVSPDRRHPKVQWTHTHTTGAARALSRQIHAHFTMELHLETGNTYF